MQASLLLGFLLPCFGSAEISVFGHKAPDTDTITSAIAYAWELNERKIPAKAYRLGELNPETAYVLKQTGDPLPPLLDGDLPEKTKVAITDTNNAEELPAGLDKAKVHSIVDHHKLFGNIKSSEPIDIDMRVLCSATSILYARAKASGLTVPKNIAGLMLAGILSDSLGFRSPTTTDLDKKHAEELAKISGLDLAKFTDGMLEAKAQIGHLTAAELIVMDSKIFTIGGKKLRVSVLETTKPSVPLEKQSELCGAMKVKTTEEKLDDVLLFVVDIINEAALSVSCTDSSAKIVEKAFGVATATNGTAYLPGILSRKKQMIPKLEAAAAKAEL